MNIIVITGDRSFKVGHPRFDLQALSAGAGCFEALYWGPGALWPSPKSDSFEIVTTQDPFWRGLLGVFLARRFKARLNVQVHADIQAQPLHKRLLAQFVLRRADSVRVVSEALKAQVGFILTGNVRRRTSHISVTVLPVFVDVERFRSIQRAPDPHPMILWIGRFEEEKDPLRALSVFQAVHQEIPCAKLIMLGMGSLEWRLRREAAGLPVEFPGWQDTAPYLARAHIVLSTSRAESWGASIIEALAAGVPVVAPDVGIAREAGAIVAERKHLAETVVTVLHARPHAVLALPLLSRDEWAAVWRGILIPIAAST